MRIAQVGEGTARYAHQMDVLAVCRAELTPKFEANVPCRWWVWSWCASKLLAATLAADRHACQAAGWSRAARSVALGDVHCPPTDALSPRRTRSGHAGDRALARSRSLYCSTMFSRLGRRFGSVL